MRDPQSEKSTVAAASWKRSPLPLRLARHPAVAALFLAGAAIGGCDACRKVAAHTKSPPPQTVETAVREKLERAREQATQLCGVPVSGLRDLKLKIESSVVPGVSKVTVEGSPVIAAPSSASPATSGSAKAAPAIPPALCVGVLTAMMVAKTDAKGEIESWSLRSLEVDEVTTPGAEWKRPPSHHDWD